MKKYSLILILLLAGFLRFYKLSSVPVSLYWDEVSLGYNAYSILKTGRDEHGNFLPLTNFPAFGDYKPPLYIYATVPSIAAFGLNEFAVRFPSAFFGTLTVLLTYFLVKKLTDSQKIGTIAAFFLAISPWHLQFSRGAFEGNLGLFFSTLGIFLFLQIPKIKWFILPSLASFLAAMYTFTGQRLFVPFILIILFIQFRKDLVKNFKITVFTVIILATFFWPLYRFATQTIEGRLRFEEVTIFKDLDPINLSVAYREKDNFAWWSGIIHNRRINYAYQYLIHYFDAFNPSFLFSHGDVNPRLSIQEVGELYYFDLPLILAGIYCLFSSRQKYRFLIIGWLLVSPMGPATARETPHALRMIHILPTFQIISALGAYYLYQLVKNKKVYISVLSLVIFLNLFYYLHMYYIHWPLNFSGAWQYGYKQAIESIKPLYNESDQIIVSNSLGRPYIYALFYLPVEPEKYLKKRNVYKDKFAFIHVDGFDKFRFVDGIEPESLKGKSLYVMPPGLTPANANIIKEIKNPKGDTVFEISQLTI